MKVLIVSKASTLAVHRGKLRELVKLGVDLTVIVPPRWGNQPVEMTDNEGYTLRILRCWFTPYNHFHFYPARVGPIDADIVYLEEEPWSLVTHQFMRLCVKARKPTIFMSFQNIYKNYPPPFDYFERYTFTHAAAAIPGNEEVLQILRAKGFSKPASIIAFGLNPEVFAKRDASLLRKKLGIEGSFVVGFMGRIVPEKGVADLIRAFALLPSSSALLMVGNGQFRNEAQQLAETLGVTARIHWVPPVASLDIADYMNLLDVLVLPSRTTPRWKEQFGRVLIEAMACEKTPVGSTSGEIPNVIADAGLTFPEGNVDALAAQLRRLYDNPELRNHLGAKGRARVLQNFTDRRIAQKNFDFYQEILALHRAGDQHLVREMAGCH